MAGEKDARVLIEESKIALPRPIAFKKVEPKVFEFAKTLLGASDYSANESALTALVTESFIFPYMSATGTNVVSVNLLGIDDKPIAKFNSEALQMNANDVRTFVPSIIIPEGKSVKIQLASTTTVAFIAQLWGLRLER